MDPHLRIQTFCKIISTHTHMQKNQSLSKLTVPKSILSTRQFVDPTPSTKTHSTTGSRGNDVDWMTPFVFVCAFLQFVSNFFWLPTRGGGGFTCNSNVSAFLHVGKQMSLSNPKTEKNIKIVDMGYYHLSRILGSIHGNCNPSGTHTPHPKSRKNVCKKNVMRRPQWMAYW